MEPTSSHSSGKAANKKLSGHASAFQRTLTYAIIALVVLVAVAFVFVHEHRIAVARPATQASTTASATNSTAVASSSIPKEIPGLVSSIPAPHTASEPEVPATNATAANATFSVGSTTYPIEIVSGESVDAAMHDLAQANPSFTFTEKNYPGLGEFIESINGLANSGSTYWFLYINGKSSQTGASSTYLHPGDSVSWRYEKNTLY